MSLWVLKSGCLFIKTKCYYDIGEYLYVILYRINFLKQKTSYLTYLQMKADKNRNISILKTTFWKWLLYKVKCHRKLHQKNVTFSWQELHEKVIHWIVAITALARFHIVMHSCAVSSPRKVILCETNNIFYSQGN